MDKKRKARFIKLLGLIWNPDTDEFYISTKRLENIEQKKKKKGKEKVLATLTSIFNPLGMITPITLKMKLFLQELWKKENNCTEDQVVK